MALKLVEIAPPQNPRGPRADRWSTISGWLWAAYFATVAGALLAWAL